MLKRSHSGHFNLYPLSPTSLFFFSLFLNCIDLTWFPKEPVPAFDFIQFFIKLWQLKEAVECLEIKVISRALFGFMRHLTKPSGKTAVQYSTLYSVISSCMDCLRWYEHWFAVDRIQHCVQVHCQLWEHVHGLFTSVWLVDYECWFAVDHMQCCIQVHCWLWGHVHGLFTTVWVLICSWSHAALCSSTLPALRTCPDPTAFWPWCIWQKCLAQS